MNKLRTARVAVQIMAFVFAVTALFLLSFPFKFIETKEFFLTSPSLVSFAMIAATYFTKGAFFLLIFIVLALLLGRVFCGWLCPYGAVMDFFAFVFKPFFKKRVEDPPGKGLMSKYILLCVFLVLAVLGFQFVWIFEPITVFSRFVSLSFFPFINNIVDSFFRYTIMNHNFGENIYYAIRNTVFDSRSITFHYQIVFFLLFIIPVIAVLFKKRFWCRYICPMGASLGVLSVKPKFPLRKEACRLDCGRCEQMCRSNAIRHDGSYISSECVMCMDCTTLKCYQPGGSKSHSEVVSETKSSGSDCEVAKSPAKPSRQSGKKIAGNSLENTVCHPELVSGFVHKQQASNTGKISRQQFLMWSGLTIAAMYMLGRKAYGASHRKKHPVIRPPGAMTEKEFKQACVRCGNCMKVCITNGLQPVVLQSGIDGVWTPAMDNIIGYCEYSCNACGNVCPTQAIKALPMEEKMKQKMGNAVVVKEKCVPWKDGIECLVCEEHCPVPDKAIKLEPEIVNGQEVNVPVVDFHLCVGCGVCENKCPVEGKDRGITVKPL